MSEVVLGSSTELTEVAQRSRTHRRDVIRDLYGWFTSGLGIGPRAPQLGTNRAYRGAQGKTVNVLSGKSQTTGCRELPIYGSN